MPTETQRLERGLARRDRLIIATILTATGITIAGASFAHGDNPHRGSNCITYDHAGVMGGGTWHLCGTTALRFCKHQPETTAAADCATLLEQRETSGSRGTTSLRGGRATFQSAEL